MEDRYNELESNISLRIFKNNDFEFGYLDFTKHKVEIKTDKEWIAIRIKESVEILSSCLVTNELKIFFKTMVNGESISSPIGILNNF